VSVDAATRDPGRDPSTPFPEVPAEFVDLVSANGRSEISPTPAKRSRGPVTAAEPDLSDEPSLDDESADPTVTLVEFIARRDENAATPLISCEQGSVLTPGGLVIVPGKSGCGKTTWTVDVCLHAASATDHGGFTFPRPVRILFVQNEGPREAFREKLERRATHWRHPTEPLRVWDEPARWGRVKVSDDEQRAAFQRVVADHRTDLIVSDSLTRFGMRGNGTPEETRDFMLWLSEIGLGRTVAFWLLHHPLTRHDPSMDELEQIAGAWAPHADAILMLKKLDGNRARLSYPKLRWARGQRPATILGFDPDTETFSYLADETPDDNQVTDDTYEQRIIDHLTAHPWAKTADLETDVEGKATPLREARKRLEENGSIIRATSRELGRSGTGNYWNLSTGAGYNPVPLPGTERDEQAKHPLNEATTPSLRPYIRGDGVGDGPGDGPPDDELERLLERHSDIATGDTT
jgi:hypothetical protein